MICLVWGAGIVCLLCVLFFIMRLVWGVRHKIVDMVCLVWDNYIVVVIVYQCVVLGMGVLYGVLR